MEEVNEPLEKLFQSLEGQRGKHGTYKVSRHGITAHSMNDIISGINAAITSGRIIPEEVGLKSGLAI